MASQRFLPFGLILALPVLTACNQTAAAPEAAPATAGVSTPTAAPSPGLPGSRAMAAILDMQQTQAEHSLTATMANHAASLDRTGLSAYGTKAMYEEQARVQQQKMQRMLTEVNKLVEEAEALGELHESMERQKASSAAGSRRKTTP
jgi:hypothetical protein